MSARGEVSVIPLEGLPELREATTSARCSSPRPSALGGLADGDVVVVAQKAVSKVEGRIVRSPTSSRPPARSSWRGRTATRVRSR